MALSIRKGKLRPEDELTIRSNYTFLLSDLDSPSIAQFLFAGGVLDKSEEEEIIKLTTLCSRETANLKLLSIILFSGPGDAYGIFHKSLEQKQSHFLKILTESRAKHVPAQQTISRDSEESISHENSDDIESDGPGNESGDANTYLSEVSISQIDTVSSVQEETASQNLLKEMEELRKQNGNVLTFITIV